MFDNSFVSWRTAGLLSRIRDQSPVLRDGRILIVTDRMIVKDTGRQVAMDLCNREFVLIQSEGLHKRVPFTDSPLVRELEPRVAS